MSRLRRVTLLPEEIPDGIVTQSIGSFLDPRQQYRYATQIAQIRALCPTLEDKKRNEQHVAMLKRSLPAGIVSAVVSGGMSEQNVVERNGVIAIDIDAKDNPAINDWEAFKRELAKSRFIAYAGLSISGLGVFALIPIADPERHKEHFAAIVQDFKKATFTFMQAGDTETTTLNGVNLDEAPKNIASKRFVSYDPQPYANTSAAIYCKTYEPPKTTPRFSTPYNASWSVREWLERHNIPYNMRERHGGIQYIVTCPWHHLHSSRSKGESAVFEYPDGKPGYKCLHGHCADKHWPEFRDFYEPRHGRTPTIPVAGDLDLQQDTVSKLFPWFITYQRSRERKASAETLSIPNTPALKNLVERFDLEIIMSPDEVLRWQQQVELGGVPF